jgi:hypothetical protein
MTPECNPILQFKRNPQSRASAVKAKCAECFGCSEKHIERGFRESIIACKSYDCPLHGFRPFQLKKR